MPKWKDLTNQQIGYLVILGNEPAYFSYQNNRSYAMWKCYCKSCGSICYYRASLLSSRQGVRSCGCLMGGKRGGYISVATQKPFARILRRIMNRTSGEVAPFIVQSNPIKLFVADTLNPYYQESVNSFGEDFLIGIYSDDSSSLDLKEDYVYTIKKLAQANKISVSGSLDAIESLIHKQGRKLL